MFPSLPCAAAGAARWTVGVCAVQSRTIASEEPRTVAVTGKVLRSKRLGNGHGWVSLHQLEGGSVTIKRPTSDPPAFSAQDWRWLTVRKSACQRYYQGSRNSDD